MTKKIALARPNPSGLCMCGCGEPAPISTVTSRGRGYVKGEPMMYLPRHHLRAMIKQPYAIDSNGCWVWQKAKDPDGYGLARRPGSRTTARAHRLYYEMFRGEVPEGLHLDHLCRNRSCVNPSHLEPVTSTENTRRGVGPKITKEIADTMRDRLARGERACDLAAEYGVSRPVVTCVKKGRTWR